MRLFKSGHYSFTSPHRRSTPLTKKKDTIYTLHEPSVGTWVGSDPECLFGAPDGIYQLDGKEIRVRNSEIKLISDPKEREYTYNLSRSMVNIFRSRALTLYETAQNTPSTQILTYKADQPADPYQDLNRYLTNLRSNYGLQRYCSALEVTQKGQYHFHLMVDMPFIETKKINKAWNRAANFSSYAGNALRDHRTIKSEIAVLKYCSDYYTKRQSKNHHLKKFTYSKNIMGNEYIDIPDSIANRLLHSKEIRSIGEKELEYCTVGRAYLDGRVGSHFQINQYFQEYYQDLHCEV